MSRQNMFIALVVVLVIALGIVIWMNNSKETIAPEISNNTQNTDSESEEANSNSNGAEILPINENEEFEKTLGATSTNWTLWKATVNQKALDMSMNVPAPLTLQFDVEKNTYSGFAGCNSFTGTYSSADNYVFDFGATASTKKACPATMELENGILQAMDKAISYGIKGEQLVFTSEDGYTELVYDQAK